MDSAHARVHFDYIAPQSMEAALLELRKSPNAMMIAGGTDVIPRWRNGSIQPDLLVDLRLLGLSFITEKEDRIHIGACTTHSQMIASELLAGHYPALVEAVRQIASPPIRNRGTIGGNLVNASPAADTAPPLLAYDARLVLVKEGSRRVVPVEKFFIGPGETIKERDELLSEVQLPIPQPSMAGKFLKLGNRQAMAIAIASVAVRLSLGESDEVTQARIALGSVAPIPLRALKAEALLLGEKFHNDVIAEAARLAQGEVSPISDIRASSEYRSRMVAVLVRRALTSAWAGLDGKKRNG